LAVREKFKDIYEKPEIDQKNKSNKIQILGAYGTQAPGFGTSSFLLNSKNVIDAGNLLRPLKESSIDIQNIWLTHYIIGLPETLKALRENFLNNSIWPDFSKIPLTNSDKMAIKYMDIELGKVYGLGNGEFIEAFPTDHTVASCGYIFTKDEKSVLITADTYDMKNIFEIIESREDIKSVVFECSFPSSMEQLAISSKHLTPKLLFKALESLKRDDFNLYINHIKPSFINIIASEIHEMCGKWDPVILKDEDNINF